jgi:hypothetical protein
MKKITAMIVPILVCLFATRVFAYTDLSTIPSLPYTINSVPYSDVVYNNRIVIFFNRNQVNITIVPDAYGDLYEITDKDSLSRIYYYPCNPPGDPVRSNCGSGGYASDILPRMNGTYGTGFYSSVIAFPDASFVFPIPYDLNENPYTAYTAPVSSVMDHSMPNGPYSQNGIVLAFNGETGDNQSFCYDSPGCSVVGYTKTGSGYFFEDGNGQKIINYPGSPGGHNDTYLFYDGHPGYDYPFSQGTYINAPAAGTLCIATTTYTTVRSPADVWREATTNCPLPSVITERWLDSEGYNAFYIFHPGLYINGATNDYLTVFLHSAGLESSVRSAIESDGYVNVTQNQHIADVGDIGAFGHYHLHFEVYRKNTSTGDWDRVDPYGDGTNDILWQH